MIIAAEKYSHLPIVRNSFDDALGIARALASRGFTLIRMVSEPSTREELIFHVKSIAQQSQIRSRPAVVFFYFAGHGLQDAQYNYIFPLEADRKAPLDSGVLVHDVMTILAPSLGSFSAVLIDACRAGGPQETFGEKKGGLVDVIGGVLGLATKPGQLTQSTALSNPGRSPYSIALERRLATSSGSFAKVLEDAGLDVTQNTARPVQIPDIYNAGTMATSFYLRLPHPEKREQFEKLQSILRLPYPKRCLQEFLLRGPAGPYARAAYDFLLASENPASSVCTEVDL